MSGDKIIQDDGIEQSINDQVKAMDEIFRNVTSPLDVDSRSLWLNDFGILTNDFLEAIILRMYAIDEDVRYIETDYDRFKGNLHFKIHLKPWAYWFRKNKIFSKYLIFIENNLAKYDVKIEFFKYKIKKHVG